MWEWIFLQNSTRRAIARGARKKEGTALQPEPEGTYWQDALFIATCSSFDTEYDRGVELPPFISIVRYPVVQSYWAWILTILLIRVRAVSCGAKFYTCSPPTPENSWRVAFQGLFFASRTTFSHISGFFARVFFHKRTRAIFEKATGSAEPRASENKIVHATLVLQWCPKSLSIPIFKAYERKWPKMLSGKNAQKNLMS